MQARVMFEAAADMGDPGGQVALAYMHMYGLGTPVNATAARLAYEAAAAVGDPEGCYNLGHYYGGQRHINVQAIIYA